MATASMYLSSTDSPDCDPCARDTKENEATCYCLDCKEYICEMCNNFHSLLGMTKDHVIKILVPTPLSDKSEDGSSKGIMSKLKGLLKRGKQPINGTKQDSQQVPFDHMSERKGEIEDKKTIIDLTVPKQAFNKVAAFFKDLSLGVTPGTGQSSSSAPSSSRHPTYSTAILMNKFDASHEDDATTCHITGILVVRDLMLLTDNQNNKIKVFNKRDFNIILQMRLEEPYALTEINGDTIAVTSGLKKYFTLFSLNDDGLTKLRRVKTQHTCWGICHHDARIYVVCKETELAVAEIDVFTSEGKMCNRLEPLFQGYKVLQNPYYITANHQTGILYIGDWDTDAVVGFSLSGKVLLNQPVMQCKSAGGVAVDDQGQLYVCGGNSNNVIRMSPEGMTSEVLVTTDIKWPQCLHIHGDQLILGCQDTSIVRIYELS